jgi:phosphatidylserine decarboxylase
MSPITFVHDIIDRALEFVKLVQNREIGWQTVDRKTGQYKREQQPILKKLKLLFLFSPVMTWLDRTHLLRLWIHDKTIEAGKTSSSFWSALFNLYTFSLSHFTTGEREASKRSASQIQPFVEFYGIDMRQFHPSSIYDYRSFDDFFIREHAPGSRPIYKPDDDSAAVVVADSRVVVYPTLSETRKLWIKGRNFTMEELLLDRARAKLWNDGAIASFRLSPQDYHRYHSPVSGTVTGFKAISGEYYQVDPLCLSSDVDILTRNARCCIEIETKEFGRVLFVAIGATDVGTVKCVVYHQT